MNGICAGAFAAQGARLLYLRSLAAAAQPFLWRHMLRAKPRPGVPEGQTAEALSISDVHPGGDLDKATKTPLGELVRDVVKTVYLKAKSRNRSLKTDGSIAVRPRSHLRRGRPRERRYSTASMWSRRGLCPCVDQLNFNLNLKS